MKKEKYYLLYANNNYQWRVVSSNPYDTIDEIKDLLRRLSNDYTYKIIKGYEIPVKKGFVIDD